MKFEGTFLGYESSTFTTDDGQTLPYYKIHAWTPGNLKYHGIKVSTQFEKQIRESNLSFGDKFTCEVEAGVDKWGKAFLRVINW